MIQEIERRISQLKQDTAKNLLLIGDELRAAKEELPHGDFSQWVQEKAGFSLRTARNLMSAAAAFPPSKRQALSGLSISKIYILAGLTDEERQALPAADMTTRELKRAADELRHADKLENFRVLPDGFKERAREIIRDCSDITQLKEFIEAGRAFAKEAAEVALLAEMRWGELLKQL